MKFFNLHILHYSNIETLSEKVNYFRYFIVICIFIGSFSSLFAQQAPKRELRAAWIATVANIDWPSIPGLPTAQQKAEYIRLLDKLKEVGMNAVVVQIRPAADAFYPSALEPWSYWLTGKQGKAPAPFYDPLKFMIKEAHKRGMEFHAWCNPYRAVFDVRKEDEIAKSSPVRKHPEWFVKYGSKKYFNPGLPAVRNFLVAVITDIVKRYDVDAVHFDDYFYPYRIAGKEFPDGQAFKKYGDGRSREDWRRHNVDTVIQMLSTAIKTTKPFVKFGISPFGVWRNKEDDPDGSLTRAGQTNYDDLYADVLLWLKKGWIDYVCPQIYWDFNQTAAPYGVLLKWWANHTYGRQLYIGQGLYRIGSRGAWKDPDEMPRQIDSNRTYPQVKGSIYFSAVKFYKNPLGFNDSLINHFYKYPAIPPRMPWIDSIAPAPPLKTGVLKTTAGNILEWKDEDQHAQTKQFVVYRFPDSIFADISNPKYILQIVNKEKSAFPDAIQSYLDRTAKPGVHYIYQVTALDRLHNESSVWQDSAKVKPDTVPFKKVPKAIYQGK